VDSATKEATLNVNGAVAAASAARTSVEALPPINRASPAVPSLKSLVISGSAWTLGTFFVMQALRLASNVLLSRLLFLEVFGLMAIVNTVLQGIQMFSDIGIAQSIIQHRRGDDATFINTAWTIQAVRGVGLFLIASALAWPLSVWYQQPAISVLIPVMSLSAIMNGLNSTKLVVMNRSLAMGRLAVFDVGVQVTTIAVMVVWARFSPSVWALVAGALASAALKLVLSHLLFDGTPNRFCWDAGVRRELLKFGRWIFLSSALNFLAASGDRVVLAKYFSIEMLGVYSIAFFLADSMGALTSSLSHRVLFPAFGRIVRGSPENLCSSYYAVRRRWDLLTMPAAGLLIGAGSLIVHTLYDSRYEAAGWMLEILAWRAVWRCLMSPGSVCLLALGKPQYATIELFLRSLWVLLGIPLASLVGGDRGVVAVVGSAGMASMPVIWWGLHKARVFKFRYEFPAVIYLSIGIAAGWLLKSLVVLL
jgi:O-antigen/teichoic acid export membrane protein